MDKFLGEFKIQKYCTRQMLLFKFLIISCGSEAVFHADMHECQTEIISLIMTMIMN